MKNQFFDHMMSLTTRSLWAATAVLSLMSMSHHHPSSGSSTQESGPTITLTDPYAGSSPAETITDPVMLDLLKSTGVLDMVHGADLSWSNENFIFQPIANENTISKTIGDHAFTVFSGDKLTQIGMAITKAALVPFGEAKGKALESIALHANRTTYEDRIFLPGGVPGKSYVLYTSDFCDGTTMENVVPSWNEVETACSGHMSSSVYVIYQLAYDGAAKELTMKPVDARTIVTSANGQKTVTSGGTWPSYDSKNQ